MGAPVGSNQVVIGPLHGKPSTKKLTRIYNQAFEQISNLWKMLPESAKANFKCGNQSENIEGLTSAKSKIEDLEERVSTLKGKQDSYKEKMAKKKLKNQLKKKKKTEAKQVLKEEKKQKKKELREQKLAEKMKNGNFSENVLKKRIDEIVEEIDSSSANETQPEEQESVMDVDNDVKKPKPKKNKQKKIKIEDLPHDDKEAESEIGIQEGGLSKKKQKYIARKEQKAEKKREKRKLIKMKKKEESLAKAQELIKMEETEEKVLPIAETNKDSIVTFNKMDFDSENVKKKFKKEKPRTEKDPVKALTKIEELNKKITELKEAGDEEKAATIQSNELWKTAILKADGVKVKDDVRRLKKTIRRKEKKKNKSKTDWAKRKEVTEKKVSEAQKKRTENIQKKKKEKKQKKIKKSIKKGRIVI